MFAVANWSLGTARPPGMRPSVFLPLSYGVCVDDDAVSVPVADDVAPLSLAVGVITGGGVMMTAQVAWSQAAGDITCAQ